MNEILKHMKVFNKKWLPLIEEGFFKNENDIKHHVSDFLNSQSFQDTRHREGTRRQIVFYLIDNKFLTGELK